MINTTAQEAVATSIMLFLKKDKISAVMNPAMADAVDLVAVKMAGTVITVRVTYGT